MIGPIVPQRPGLARNLPENQFRFYGLRSIRRGLSAKDASMTDEKEGSEARSTANETPPDRLSTNPASPFHNAELLERGVGVRFNGVERNNVEEYCVSEGWVRLAVGRTVDRHGNAMTVKYKGKVEPYLR
jgi:hypothetical protein